MDFASTLRCTSPSGQRRDQLLEHLVDAVVVLELAADAHRLAERDEHLLLDLAVELARDFLLRDLALLLADLLRQIVDDVDDLPDGGVRRVERLDDFLFGGFLRAGLDHHDAVAAARDDQIEAALAPLRVGRVDDELPVHQADPHAGDRLLERDLGDREGGRCAGDREHVGVVLGVGREHERDDLRLVAPAVREQRPDRPVGHAAGEHFLLGRLAFALEEAAGDAA